jgi:hypothetical protein
VGPTAPVHNGAGIRRFAATDLGLSRLARARDASAGQRIAAPIEQIDRSSQGVDLDPRFQTFISAVST